MTTVPSPTPYCTPARLALYHDRRSLADLCRDESAPPAMPATVLASPVILAALEAASGLVNAACLAGGRYKPSDLVSLADAGKAYLEKLTADLAYWGLAQRRSPISANLSNVPGAAQAYEELDRLRNGERIFAFAESADAGLPSVTDDVRRGQLTAPKVVQIAGRLFGSHGKRG